MFSISAIFFRNRTLTTSIFLCALFLAGVESISPSSRAANLHLISQYSERSTVRRLSNRRFDSQSTFVRGNHNFELLASESSNNNSPKKLPDMHWKSAVLGFLGGMCFTFLSGAVLSSAATNFYPTAADIPSAYFKEQKVIEAVVVKITDGDTFRVRHVTALHSDPKFTGTLTDNTIVVRIAAVDTPETAKFGNKGQAFAEEAKEFVKTNLLNKRVKVQLLSRDQYGRVIGLVKYRSSSNSGWFGSLFGSSGTEKDLSEELLLRGLAVVYRQGGAQYGVGKVAKWDAIEQRAIRDKRGVWENGAANADLPSDYKKKTKAATAAKASKHAYL